MCLLGQVDMMRDLVQWAGGRAAIVLGDFNAEPQDPMIDLARAAGWTDAWEAATGSRRSGFTADPRNSHHLPTDPAQRIDYVFVMAGAATVLDARVVLDAPDATGEHASDHFGVWAELSR